MFADLVRVQLQAASVSLSACYLWDSEYGGQNVGAWRMDNTKYHVQGAATADTVCAYSVGGFPNAKKMKNAPFPLSFQRVKHQRLLGDGGTV